MNLFKKIELLLKVNYHLLNLLIYENLSLVLLYFLSALDIFHNALQNIYDPIFVFFSKSFSLVYIDNKLSYPWLFDKKFLLWFYFR